MERAVGVRYSLDELISPLKEEVEKQEGFQDCLLDDIVWVVQSDNVEFS